MPVPRYVPVLLLFGASLLAPGCGSDAAVVAPSGPDVYHVTQERNGDTIRVVPGQVVAVLLPNKVGSSSRWSPSIDDPSVLRQESGTQTIGPRTGGAIVGGARGYERMDFRALAPGTTRLTMSLARRVEDGGGVATFQVDVVVQGATRR